MSYLARICLVSILISSVFACTKDDLIKQIDQVTKALDAAAPQLKTLMDNKSLPDKAKKALAKAHSDMLKFKKDKETIKKNVQGGKMTVDEGCAEAAKLAAKFQKDIQGLQAAMQ